MLFYKVTREHAYEWCASVSTHTAHMRTTLVRIDHHQEFHQDMEAKGMDNIPTKPTFDDARKTADNCR